MRGTPFAAAVLAAGVLLAGAGPALATGGGNDTSAKLRKAVSVDGIRLHQAAFNLAGIATGGNRLAGTRGYELSADYVALQARLAGLNVSRQDFEYDLYFLGDWKPPVLDVRRGKHYIPEIFGGAPGPRATSARMIDSASGDVTGAACGRPTSRCPPGGERVGLGVRGRGLRRHARRAPIVLMQRRRLRRASPKYLNAQAAGAGAIVYINEGSPGEHRTAGVRSPIRDHGAGADSSADGAGRGGRAPPLHS